MSYTIDVDLDQGALAHLLKAPSGVVQTFMRRVAEQTADGARRNAPVQTGRLKSSIVVRRAEIGTWEVSAETDYAYKVHEGTGKKKTTAKKIRKGGGVRISASKKGSGKGAQGQPFLMDALRQAVNALA